MRRISWVAQRTTTFSRKTLFHVVSRLLVKWKPTRVQLLTKLLCLKSVFFPRSHSWCIETDLKVVTKRRFLKQEADTFFPRIVTWVHYWDPETKLDAVQWKHMTSSVPHTSFVLALQLTGKWPYSGLILQLTAHSLLTSANPIQAQRGLNDANNAANGWNRVKKAVPRPPCRRKWGEETQLLLTIVDGVWSASRLGSALPQAKGPNTHWIWGWMGLRAGLDTKARGKILCLCQGSNPSSTICSQTIYWLSYPS
jgi:hypothetical protein